MQKFDLITIGGGSGGIAGSRRAAEYGAKVALIESTQLGGTCVLRGCVPKKLLVYAADFGAEFAEANGYGWQFGGATPTHDWSHLIAEKNREVNRLSDIYHDMLASSKVTLIKGRAEIIAAAPDQAVQIRVGDDIYESARILIATGGQAVKPNCPGGELALISDDMLNLPALPRQVAIIGGGYIAVEFASLLHGLGVEIELILRSDRLLSGFDHELGAKLRDSFVARGIKIHTHASLSQILRRDDASPAAPAKFRIDLANGTAIETECVFSAIGRRPNLNGLGLAKIGIDCSDKGAIKVNEHSQTNIPSIYAVGDVTDRLALTPVAIGEARAVAESLYNNNPMIYRHDNVPSAVFCRPEIASVGLSEEKARQKYGEIAIYHSQFRPMKTAFLNRPDKTMMKLVVDKTSDRVIGAHMIGPDAAEIIQGIAIAVTAGATKRDFDRTTGIHPTAAEEFCTMRSETMRGRAE